MRILEGWIKQLGGKVHYRNDWIHRDDGPAIIWDDGGEAWYQNGELHRSDGPAYIHADGTEEFWLNGKQVDPLKHFVNQDV